MTKSNWPQPVWSALNQLAELDMAHYPKHIHNRQAFLDKARTERAQQHEALIDNLLYTNPHATAAQIIAACNPTPAQQRSADPEWARRRDYDHGFVGGNRTNSPPCIACGGHGIVGDQFCTCTRGLGKQFFAALKLIRKEHS